MNIHPTAIIDKQVKLGSNVEIGAYSVIKGDVEIGNDSVIKDNVTIYGPLKMGVKNIIHPGAVLGNISQDLKYKGEKSVVVLGDNNVIRECVTVQQGTVAPERKTVVGNNNFIMAYTHVAHDCILGDNIIIANATQLAGHIIIKDFAYLGGIVGVHQFVTIGRNSFIGFMSRITRDVPPFTTVEGNPSRERCINTVGLKRRNFSSEDISIIKKAFMVLYMSGKTYPEKVKMLHNDDLDSNPFVKELMESIEASARGKNGRALEAMRK